MSSPRDDEAPGASPGEAGDEPPDAPSPRLAEASYIVLGLLELAGQGTPYDLKRAAQMSTSNFWSIPHTQLYTECARLAGAGLLDERREQTGRRRRTYSLTDRGRRLLEQWRDAPTAHVYELRDASTLKLFFGGDPAKLAAAQLEAHRQRLKGWEEIHANLPAEFAGQRLALECGIGHEREFVGFWERLLATEDA